MQNFVENTYSVFVGRVSEGRGIDEAEVRRIAEGRVWVGSKAVELKLVDEIGGLQQTLAAMLKECRLDRYEYRLYPQVEEDFWQKLVRQSGNLEALQQGSLRFDAESLRAIMLVDRLKTRIPYRPGCLKWK